MIYMDNFGLNMIFVSLKKILIFALWKILITGYIFLYMLF